MESFLSQTFQGVYVSTKEIIQSNQRNLFANALSILSITTKATGKEGTGKISNDDLVHFWLKQVLPLVFDEDKIVQANASEAMEQGIGVLEVSNIHKSLHWPDIKNTIINTYAPEIHKLRDEKKKLWAQIWCLLVSILDREILKGASTINAFLSIVEMGFRHSDNNVRSEAFVCWRLLIKIFDAYGEITLPKRSKLICIPLKSSQSKSAEAADAKLRTWWYLISCLGNDIEELFKSVVEPFLIFCFATRNGVNISQQFPSVRNLMFTCLSSLLTYEKPNKFLERMIVKHKVERLAVNPKTLINQHWRSLSYAVFEATKVILKCSCDSGEDDQHKFLEIIQPSLIDLLLTQDNTQSASHFWLELSAITQDLSATCNHKINSIMLTLGNKNSILHKNIDENEIYSSVLNNLLKLCIIAKPIVSPDLLNKCIENIFSLPEGESRRNDRTQWRSALINLVNVVLDSSAEDNFETFETKLMIWRYMSVSIIVPYLNENRLNYRLKEFCLLIDRWVLWPLRSCVDFAGNPSRAFFDSTFCTSWKQMLTCGQNSPERRTFLKDLNIVLKDLLKVHREEETFIELFNSYGDAVCKLKMDNNFSHFHEFFELQDLIISASVSNKFLNACLNTLQHIFLNLSDQYISTLFETLKPIFARIVQLGSKGKIEKSFFEKWKQSIMEKLKVHSNKQIATQIKDLFKQKDDFVIIPTIWSLDPERLTDRQKERIKEKPDIPALYNDMSHSQESASLKPWTPKKVVIAKDARTEISIEAIRGDDNDKNSGNESLIHLSVTQTPKNLSVSNVEPKRTRSSKKDETVKIIDISAESPDLNKELKPISENPSPESGSNIIKRTRVTRLRQQQQQKKQDPIEQTVNGASKDSKVIAKGTPGRKPKSPIKQKAENPVVDVNTLPNKETEILKEQTEKTDSSEEQSDVITENPVSVPQQLEEISATDLELPLNTSTQIINNVPNDVPSTKEVSPKRNPIRYQPLSSPPDRRLTNNTSSPTLRPKPTFLTGRGAQLINMIRNKKLDGGPTNNLPQYPNITQSVQKPVTQSKSDATSASEISDIAGAFQTSTPTNVSSDLLVFSKRLPSPTASPSASILKRRMRRDSFDDIAADSPCQKRKRVSFHDPPVSVTKEYVKDTDENKMKPKRCLLLDKSSGNTGLGTEPKHTLKRRSKLESFIEIEKYSPDLNKSNAPENIPTTLSLSTPPTLQIASDSCATDVADVSCLDGKEEVAKVVTPQDALEVVVQSFTLEDVLERYFEKDTSSHAHMTNSLTNCISKCMETNPKIKSNVLEKLSEKHSKDFLDHAVQENLSTVVCDRLNLNSVLNYVCEKSKINLVCRTSLLEHIPDILNNSRLDSERFDLIKRLVENGKLIDDQIFELMKCLISMRTHSVGVSISESAADSSSNL